jgi:hypothetical protein
MEWISLVWAVKAGTTLYDDGDGNLYPNWACKRISASQFYIYYLIVLEFGIRYPNTMPLSIYQICKNWYTENILSWRASLRSYCHLYLETVWLVENKERLDKFVILRITLANFFRCYVHIGFGVYFRYSNLSEARFSVSVLTGRGSHPAYYAMVAVSFTG